MKKCKGKIRSLLWNKAIPKLPHLPQCWTWRMAQTRTAACDPGASKFCKWTVTTMIMSHHMCSKPQSNQSLLFHLIIRIICQVNTIISFYRWDYNRYSIIFLKSPHLINIGIRIWPLNCKPLLFCLSQVAFPRGYSRFPRNYGSLWPSFWAMGQSLLAPTSDPLTQGSCSIL